MLRFGVQTSFSLIENVLVLGVLYECPGRRADKTSEANEMEKLANGLQSSV